MAAEPLTTSVFVEAEPYEVYEHFTRADAEWVFRVDGPGEFIEENIYLLCFAVQVNLDAFGLALSVIAHHHMVPLVQFQRLSCLQSHPDIGPAHGDVQAYLAVLQVKAISMPLIVVLDTRHNGAVWAGSGSSEGHGDTRLHRPLEHRPETFIWKATAEDIIAKVQRGRETLHQIKSTTDH
jgi:hypothetical protein